ncbi:MAG: stage II sporulation protein P [Clostridia bacterium]|nr:stage II sporulation protein P [Clostridia bacterium]
MTERKIFAYFGICCAGALAMLGLMFGAAYLVSLLPEDTPERLEKLGVIKPAPSYEDSSAPPPEDGESAISGDTDFSEENGGLFVPVSLDLSRRSSGEVTLQNETSYKLDLSKAELPHTEGAIRGTPPTVLVYHTHGTESYSPSGGYGGSYSFRSEDTAKNVVAAGEALCDALREYGVFALHDLNMYDKDDFSLSYSKSRDACEEWMKKYPALRYIIDIHRDSVKSGGLAAAAVAEVEGRRAAQIMIVVGTDEKAGRHTGWKTNLANAVKLWKALYAISPSLVRPIYLRSASFNQDISPGALIIEVGSQGNTLEEAQESARLLARAMAECFS